ncbi:hypothetical protein Tco_1162534 [Tanacetum coccineum]
MNDVYNKWDDMIESRNELLQSLGEMLCQREQAANLSTYTTEHSRRFNSFYNDDDYEESTNPLNEVVSQIPPSIVISPILPTLEPEDSLIMGNEELRTIPEKESNKFIKSSVEDLVPIPSESKDTFESDSDCDLPSCGDLSSIDIPWGKSVTFSNPLFDSNDDFTSSDDESLSDEDVLKDNVKIYSNPLFKIDDEYIPSNVNPLFNEMLEDIENKDSYVFNLEEPALLVTPFSDANKDEYFDPGGEFDEIKACLTSDSIPPGIENANIDPEGDILLLEKLLNDDISFPLLLKELHFKGLNIPPDSKEFLNHDPKNLKDEPDNEDLKSMVKVFDPGIWEKNISPTYMKLPFEDRHYLSLIYVI